MNLQTLAHLYLHKYRIHLKPMKLLQLPEYKGSALRGVFGKALRRIVCVVKRQQCDECMFRYKCVYSAIMETPVPHDHPFYKRYSKAPHPYIIIPELTKERYFHTRDSLHFDIVLIGSINEYLPYFIYAFTEMGRIGIGKNIDENIGKFFVASVDALSYDGAQSEIFNNSDKVLKPSNNRIEFNSFLKEDFQGEELTISFETPVRIIENNRLVQDIPFSLFIARLYERAVLLSHLHCGSELVEHGEVFEDAGSIETINNKLKWLDWERYSAKQDTRMKFGGWTGEITYRGDIRKYWPILRTGEYIHAGKATTFGLGKYRIIKKYEV